MVMEEALTFDDVLIVPKKSSVKSRGDVDLTTKLTPKIKMKIPLISANMDTITETEMAIKMALEGGIGIIHRFMSIEEQVEMVERVKRAQNIFIEDPYTLSPENTISDFLKLTNEKDVSGILIVDKKNKLLGIVTRRDVLFEDNPEKKLSEVMTKYKDMVVSHPKTTIDEAREILKKEKIEKLPLVSHDGTLKGLITSRDVKKIPNDKIATKDSKGRLRVGAAIGVKIDTMERTEALLNAGCDVIVVDIAHGHSDLCIETVRMVKENFDVEVIAGNVATAEGTEDLIKAGADAVKVGVGPGSTCITRIVTGCGVPQLTAIIESARVGREYGIPIIADGGMRNSGDMVKALAAGASSLMSGFLFSGAKETPGKEIIKDGRKYKIYRGSASLSSNIDTKEKRDAKKWKEIDIFDITPEGIESLVPYKGSVSEVIKKLIGGIRSGMSYCNAFTIEELQKNAKFIKMTEHGLRESNYHDVSYVFS
ncbi:MAG: IMP dehydrogenase [Candidatus Aenigmatarchaeota archaeon]